MTHNEIIFLDKETKAQKAKEAKAWWGSLSFNEQKAFKVKYLGQDFPNCSVYTKEGSNLIFIYENHKKESNFILSV